MEIPRKGISVVVKGWVQIVTNFEVGLKYPAGRIMSPTANRA